MSVRRKPVPAPARTDLEVLEERWGCELPRPLLELALMHRSFANEAGGLPTNERLEFLGDSVLGIIVTERLYHDHPEVAEANLAKMRAATVSQVALAQVGRKIGLGDFVQLGVGERRSGGREKDSILCDTCEAMIGATYLTHGLELTRRIVETQLAELLANAAARSTSVDWKTTLQEYTSQHGLGAPTYQVVGEGPDHDRRFRAEAVISGQALGIGEGTSKKNAQRNAAEQAYRALCLRAQLQKDGANRPDA